MRRGRIIIFVILGILIIISLGGVGLLWYLSNAAKAKPVAGGTGTEGGPTAPAVIEVTPTPEVHRYPGGRPDPGSRHRHSHGGDRRRSLAQE